MNKIIAVSLNGNAFQIDEEGYNALRDYIDRAEAKLRDSADKREVIADLEQAIADKCAAVLRPHKNVVTASEMTEILSAIGPVQTADGQSIEVESPSLQPSGPKSVRSEWPRRRLYRIREGAKWAGVCTGIAAYADLDVYVVRVFVVIATILTGIFPGLIVYAGVAIIVPVAYSDSELAAAYSRPPELRRS